MLGLDRVQHQFSHLLAGLHERHEYSLVQPTPFPGARSVYRFLPDGTFQTEFVTPAFGDLLGYLPGELAPNGEVIFFKYAHPDDRAYLISSITSAAQSKQPWQAGYRVLHPERGLVNISATAVPEVEADGSTVWYCLVQDVTQRSRDQAKTSPAAAVFENSHAAIAIIDATGMIVAVNPSFRSIAGIYEADLQKGTALQRQFHGNLKSYRRALLSIERTGTWQGEITFKTADGKCVPLLIAVSAVKNVAGRIVNYICSMLDVSKKRQAEKELNQPPHHDPLTGLPDRHLLIQRLTAAVASAKALETKGAVLFVDLDQFTTVNDSLGTQAGDELLRTVAARLSKRVRTSGTIARVGADQFAVILDSIDTEEAACKIARDINDAVEAPITVLSSQDIYVTASVGISFFPADSQTADQLVRRAEAAVHFTKAKSRGHYQIYDARISEAAKKKIETETRMRQALAKGEFELHYQPIIDLQRNVTVGAEALIRWNDPIGGPVPPMTFIPLAEETGFIATLGDWIIWNACSQLKQWEKSGRGISVLSINLSAVQFSMIDLPLRISKILEETGVDPRSIQFEITESSMMAVGEVAISKLLALKALGVRLSIDDFGTGYSSLSMLKRLPIDTLKIDRSFVVDVNTNAASRSITLAIISLAKSLNLQIVAEGIEEEEQCLFLRDKGCKYAQGYLFGKPLSARNFELWLSHQPPARSIVLHDVADAA